MEGVREGGMVVLSDGENEQVREDNVDEGERSQQQEIREQGQERGYG